MDLTETFVVRIYRRNHAAGKLMLGTVESVGKETTQPFSSFEELRSILERSVTPGASGKRRSRAID